MYWLTLIYLFSDTYLKEIVLSDDRNVTFGILDTSGIGDFDRLNELYCRSFHAVIVVYDITNEGSLEKAKFWVEKLKEIGSPIFFKALAGNKADFVSKRMVTYKVI